ncbi:Retrotransposon gag domain [Lasallia pustulata]|uniref:Retrotransposon gag domain n=1 Tax=Lasallia pustulata TaxID=136370 RepID=A0A1W5CR86_9LECA|nr:Retrotransposon gag domain [Lasallia pustulata]
MSTTGSTKATEAKAAGPKEEAVTVKPLKLATPTIFTSNRKKLDTFLLQLYASYYLQGEAEDWFRPYIQEYIDNEDDPSEAEESIRHIFASFAHFKQEIQMVFRDIDRERTAEQDLLKLQ